MKTIDVSEALKDPAALLAEVEAGEEVVIAREGKPVVRMSRPIRREPGILSQYPEWKDWKYDPAIFAPLMTDDDLRDDGWEV